jgi:hypothetical protein
MLTSKLVKLSADSIAIAFTKPERIFSPSKSQLTTDPVEIQN